MALSKLQICVFSKILFSFLSIFVTANNVSDIDWCELSCGKEENIGCTHKETNCAIMEPCFLDTTLDKKELLHIHNKLRDKFASGGEPNFEAIRAANMMVLEWDDDLAYLAGCNMVKCLGKLEHDKCRRTPKFPSAGQNLAAATIGNKADRRNETLRGPSMWYSEIYQTSPRRLGKYATAYSFLPGIGHLTQLAWAKTTHVGCAATRDPSGKHLMITLACNYGPSGNVGGASMFKYGRPCSQCPPGVGCSSTYPNLCRGSSFLHPNVEVLMVAFFVQTCVMLAELN